MSPPTPSPQQTQTHTNTLYALYALLLTTPLLALLPPRKLDLYTLALGSAFAYSAQGVYFSRWRAGTQQQGYGAGSGEGEGEAGVAKRVWMGDEKAGWQRRRGEREREELEGGRGYGDIIMGQVREVFPGFGGGEGKGKGEGEDG